MSPLEKYIRKNLDISKIDRIDMPQIAEHYYRLNCYKKIEGIVTTWEITESRFLYCVNGKITDKTKGR